MPNQQKNGLNLSREEILAPFRDSKWGESFPPILDVQQVSTLLRLPIQTVYQMSSRGEFAACAIKVGKHLRFYRDRLLQTIFNHR
ncbi:MAG: DNA-binding protein [Planctomycetaceae bacterium]|nr:DNA-binding protein [Planctomycetaceae bacterium]